LNFLLKAGTARDVLEQMSEAFDAAELYFGHGTDNAWDEACWLLETTRRRQGLPALTADTPLTESELVDAEALFKARIATRKPLAYLLNEAWFCGLPFYVDERVLVPRSPFAELIDNGFDPLLTNAPRRILDLCTGGGCIGIACALAFPEADVVLSDISAEALEVARINVEKHGLQQRVTLVQSDLFENIEGPFDLIVSNPPYVGIDEYRELPEEYLREPELGLVTDHDGIGIPLRILERAAAFLNPEGLLFLETGATWLLLVEARPELPFLWLEFEHGGEGICALRREELPG
jgi:ribosomal protein L3 glutamine methyltransferase